MPLFPLDSAVLLPQQSIPLHIFEPRYRALVSDALDGSGQFAMAVLQAEVDGEHPVDEIGRLRLRSSVCVAQIAEHHSLPDGRFNIGVQGICRARIVSETPPEKSYRTAMLAPLINVDGDARGLEELRGWVSDELDSGPLRHLVAARKVLEFLRDDEVPTVAVLELVGFALTTDPEIRYALLSEPSVAARAGVIRSELAGLGRLLELSDAQREVDWPKGCSWN